MLLAILFISAMQTEAEVKLLDCPIGQIANEAGQCEAVAMPIPPERYYATTVRGPFMPPTPKGHPGSWVTSDDYPAAALQAELSGRSEFKLSINKWGVVADCEITSSSGSAELDEATCKNVAFRAKFYPATDKDAKPIAGTYSNRVRWEVPKDDPILPDEKYTSDDDLSDTKVSPPAAAPREKRPQTFKETGFFEVEYIVSTDGTVKECMESGELFQIMGEKEKICDQVERDGKLSDPYRDASGKPVEKKVKVRMDVKVDDIK